MFTYYSCLFSWFFKNLKFYSLSFYKKGEGLGSLMTFKLAAILDLIYLYIEKKLMIIDIIIIFIIIDNLNKCEIGLACC